MTIHKDKSLLETARFYPGKRKAPLTHQELDLLDAFMHQHITAQQLLWALRIKKYKAGPKSGAMNWVFSALGRARAYGQIEITMKEIE